VRRAGVAAAAIAALLGGCGDDDVGPPPPTGVVGEQDTVRHDGREVERIVYGSVDVRGRPSVVGALLAVPPGDPPADGWPILAYAHGTTGSADDCAPSEDPELVGVGDAVLTLAAEGYVTVATDYEGIGTPGGHPYLHGGSEARAIVDSVRAARDVVPATNGRFAVVGHSQGGHAAVWTAQLEGELDPDDELDLVGVVAQAGAADPADLLRRGGPAVESLLAAGWLTVEPDLDATTVLTAAGRQAVDDVEDDCTFDARDDVVAPDGREAFDAYLAANVAGGTAVAAPVLVAHGDLDGLVPPAVAEALADRLCDQGASVDLRVYDGADHLSVFGQSAPDVLAWLADRFAGEPAPSTCGASAP
jgi:acetyl esterase/lipase